MRRSAGRRFRFITIVYWLLLLYIVAALVWWFISLEQQNNSLRSLKIRQLRATIDSTTTPKLFQDELSKINIEHRKNKTNLNSTRACCIPFIDHFECLLKLYFVVRSIDMTICIDHFEV